VLAAFWWTAQKTAGGTAAAAFVVSSPGGEVALKKGTNIKLQLKSAIGTTQ